MSEKEDYICIEEIINGDVSAFEKIVDKYKKQTYTLALRIVRNTNDAEEVSQDAFLKAYKCLKGFKKEATFSTWLYRIVYNTALSKIKKKSLNTTVIDEHHLEIASNNVTHALSELMSEDRVKYLKQAIDELSEEDSTLINLYYTLEKDMKEIGDIMGLTHVNVRVKLSRARAKLHTTLERTLKEELKSIL